MGDQVTNKKQIFIYKIFKRNFDELIEVLINFHSNFNGPKDE